MDTAQHARGAKPRDFRINLNWGGKKSAGGEGGSRLCSHFRHPTCVNTVTNGHKMDTCGDEIGPYVLRIYTPF